MFYIKCTHVPIKIEIKTERERDPIISYFITYSVRVCVSLLWRILTDMLLLSACCVQSTQMPCIIGACNKFKLHAGINY